MPSHFIERVRSLAIVMATIAVTACSGGQQAGLLPNATSNSLTTNGSQTTSLAQSQSQGNVATQSIVTLAATSSGSSKPYQAAVLADHPSVLLGLNDSGSTVSAAAGSGLRGTYGSRVDHSGPALNADGFSSVRFSGGSYNLQSVVSISPNAVLIPSTRLSTDLWVELKSPNTTIHEIPIVSYGSKTSNVPYEILLTPRNTLKWTISAGAPYKYWGYEESTTLDVGKPYHIAATYDGATEKMYVNGQQTLSVAAPGPISTAVGKDGLTLGSEPETGQLVFDGFISDIAIYPAVLNATQVANHYAVGVRTGSSPPITPSASPSSTPIPNSVRETPKSVYAFEDSIGLNTHFNYAQTGYHTHLQQDVALVEQLPARHIRDGGTGEDDALSTLCSGNVHHSFGFPINVTAAQIKAQLTKTNPACVDFVEPANEYDDVSQIKATLDPNWATHLMAEQRLLYTTIKSDPALSHIVVLAPGLAVATRYSYLKGIDQISDAASMHDGECDGSPMTTHYQNLQTKFDQLKALYSSTKPIWTTEFAVANSRVSGCGTDLKTAATYVARQYLDRFNIGIPRSYQEQLSQVPQDFGWGVLGIVDQNANPYPAYKEVQSLLATLPSNQTSSTSLSGLGYALSGNTANVAHTLLQANDGTYYLIVWAEVDAWDVVNKKDLNPPAQAVTLAVPSSVRTALLSVPNDQSTLTTRSLDSIRGKIDLSVTDSPLVVSFKL